MTARAPRVTVEVRAVIIGDDGIYLLRADGTLERLLAPGRPGGIAAHSTATARRAT